ncbi:MAG: DUF4159 domain-containing protein, partial [Thermoguttaceae bacterium]
MKWSIRALVASGLLLAPAVTVVAADLSPDDVRNAMQLGVAYLESSQRANGTWAPEIDPRQVGGITALCTLALLNAGESPDELHVKKALEYLRKLRPRTTYVVSLQTMVLCHATPVEDQLIIARNVEWLEDAQVKSGPADRKGGWSYFMWNKRSIDADGSNSQFAMLALYEAARAAESHHIRVTIHRETWERIHSYWVNNQIRFEDHRGDYGAWPYKKSQLGTGSMTCAGIAAMVISGDVLHEPDAKVTGDQIDGCYRAPSADLERIGNGIDWLRKHFTVQGNPPTGPADGGRLWHYYYLYGLERAGRLTARRKIGEYDWYREGAKYLVHAIGPVVSRSSWRGRASVETDENLATSLALLFLSKGRWPVLMAKVQFGSPAGPSDTPPWNRHRNDVGNLTIYVESQWKKELTWQIIDLRKASVDDLLQVPVLYFSGGGDPLPQSKAECERLASNLRDYVDRGGFIFADGDGCSREFDKPFRQLMEMVFQNPEYRFKKLDASHPVWRADEDVPPNQERLLLGIDYGCRTCVVYAPADPPDDPKPSLSCLWELSRGGQRASYSPSVQEKIRGGLVIGINVLAYATNREMLEKDQIAEKIVTQGTIDKMVRGKFAVAKLEHPGGCDAAPRALANLMEQAAHELNIRVETHPKLISMQDPALFDYPVVFMHGRNAFHLTDGERQALREYV